eukprot:820059-Amphidinium_carterae.2
MVSHRRCVPVSTALEVAAEVDGTQGPLTCICRDGKSGTLVQGSSDGTLALVAEARALEQAEASTPLANFERAPTRLAPHQTRTSARSSKCMVLTRHVDSVLCSSMANWTH